MTPPDTPAEKAEKKARRNANIELAKIKGTLDGLRVLYAVFAFLLGIFLLVLLGAGHASGIVLALVGALFLTMIAGCWRVRREPLIWSVVIAVFALLCIGVELVAGTFGHSIGSWLFLLCTIGLVGGIPMAARADRLLKLYPDVSAAQILRGKKRPRRR